MIAVQGPMRLAAATILALPIGWMEAQAPSQKIEAKSTTRTQSYSYFSAHREVSSRAGSRVSIVRRLPSFVKQSRRPF
jgi:hypothetical protein